MEVARIRECGMKASLEMYLQTPIRGSVVKSTLELVTKTRTNEKVVRKSSGEQLLKGYRGEIAQRLMNTASVVEQQVFRNRI